jgi:TonB family protein
MKIFAFAASVLIGAASIVAAGPLPAAANVFCPVTIAAVADLAQLGRMNTYGVMLDFDPGDTASVRVRVDSQTTSYAVDFNDIETIGTLPLRTKRYFTLRPGERLVSAWVEATGTTRDTRTECPLTHPYQANAPAPTDVAAARFIEADRRSLLDSFSTRTPTATAQAFGPAQPMSCTQPYAPARAILPVQADLPEAARAVHATGSVIVRVDLDETSSVVDAVVVRSSGSAPLDRAAVAAVMKSQYRTETFACRSIASSYQLTVTFGGAS